MTDMDDNNNISPDDGEEQVSDGSPTVVVGIGKGVDDRPGP